LKDDLPITAAEADVEDNDPWTFFGSYSRAEIAVARNLLAQALISFHVTEAATPETSRTSHHLWVRDDHAGRAQLILVSHFQRNDSHA
jgi:hypothetical protein